MDFFARLFGRRGDVPPPAPAEREVELWDGAATIRVPAGLTLQTDDDGQVVLEPPIADTPVTLRLSLIAFKPKTPTPLAGFEHVREEAAKRGVPFEELNGLGVLEYDEEEWEGGRSLLIRYWLLGGHDEIYVASASIVRSRLNDPVVVEALARMRSILESLTPTARYEFVETPRGTIITHVSTVAKPPEQEVREFGPAEQAWLNRSLALGRNLLHTYGSGAAVGEDIGHAQFPRELDRAFSRWLADEDASNRPTADEVAEGLGATFGQHLVLACGMTWVRVSDEDGSAMAVRARPPADESTMAYPVASVEKRIESGETGFFWEIAQVVRSRVEDAGDGT